MDSRQLFEIIGDIDDNLIENSEKKSKGVVSKRIYSTIKILAACVALMLISTATYQLLNEFNKMSAMKNDNEISTEKVASVMDLSIFDVGVNEKGEITNEYYAIAAAIGNIYYDNSIYHIVVGVTVDEDGMGDKLASYQIKNQRLDIFEGEYIQIDLYEVVDVDTKASIAFKINDEIQCYFALNTAYSK